VETDEALYIRLKRGDLRAFDALYDRYKKPLFGFLRRSLGSREDAEDAFHESFLSALRAPEVAFPHEGGFRPWIFRVARNVALNRIRSTKRGEQALRRVPADGAPSAADEELASAQLRAALERAVAALPWSLAEVYHLRASGLTQEEVARVLEIPLGTLKSRIRRMVEHLREELSPWVVD
jgi:RNA polymerase sigma-70 factor (ECF subfamily)